MSLSRAILLTILFAASWWSLQLAWADHLSRSLALQDRERAVRVAPWSATAFERLADQRAETGGDPLPDLERAAALDPSNARRFERLGQRAELAGDLALAERSLLRAAELSHLYQPRYLLAQYYFRRRDPAGWERWSHEAFTIAPYGVTPLLELAVRMTGPVSLAREGETMRPAIASQFLFFLVKNGHAASAVHLARKLAETGGKLELPALLGFCEGSLADAAADPAEQVWNILCRRRLLPYSEIDRASPVTNGWFEHTPVGSAFDWHVEDKMTWQYLALQRGALYRVRVADGESQAWRIFRPTGSGWRELKHAVSFVAPAEVVRFALPRPGHGIRLELVQ